MIYFSYSSSFSLWLIIYNLFKTGTLVIWLLFWLITWMKNVNDFQKARVQPHLLLSICLSFCQFQPGVAYNSFLIKKCHVHVISNAQLHSKNITWYNVFKCGLSKFFKDCLSQNLISPLLNTLYHINPRLF